MTIDKTVGDIVNRFRAAADLQSALAVFTDEEKQGVDSKDLQLILRVMLEHDDHNKKNVDVGMDSADQWVLNTTQREVVEHLLAVLFVTRLRRQA
jgi:hypothetical protein